MSILLVFGLVYFAPLFLTFASCPSHFCFYPSLFFLRTSIPHLVLFHIRLLWFCLSTKCSLCVEIFRVSGMMSNQGFGDFDRLRHRSPSPMASSNLLSNVGGTGLSGWNGLPQEVNASFDFNLHSIFFSIQSFLHVVLYLDSTCQVGSACSLKFLVDEVLIFIF